MVHPAQKIFGYQSSNTGYRGSPAHHPRQEPRLLDFSFPSLAASSTDCGEWEGAASLLYRHSFAEDGGTRQGPTQVSWKTRWKLIDA